VSVTAKIRLEADRAELGRFVEATFRYADDGTDAVLRTFAEGSNEVLGMVRVPLNGAGLDPVIEHAAHQATTLPVVPSSRHLSQLSSETVPASAIWATAWS
jgi:hypothetical protein